MIDFSVKARHLLYLQLGKYFLQKLVILNHVILSLRIKIHL